VTSSSQPGSLSFPGRGKDLIDIVQWEFQKSKILIIGQQEWQQYQWQQYQWQQYQWQQYQWQQQQWQGLAVAIQLREQR